jgi:hypothetical protein
MSVSYEKLYACLLLDANRWISMGPVQPSVKKVRADQKVMEEMYKLATAIVKTQQTIDTAKAFKTSDDVGSMAAGLEEIRKQFDASASAHPLFAEAISEYMALEKQRILAREIASCDGEIAAAQDRLDKCNRESSELFERKQVLAGKKRRYLSELTDMQEPRGTLESE